MVGIIATLLITLGTIIVLTLALKKLITTIDSDNSSQIENQSRKTRIERDLLERTP